MKTSFVVMMVLAIVAMLIAGCATLGPRGPAKKPRVNFRFLISDEVNAIEDFDHLYVTISSVGVHRGGEEGKWHEFDLNPEADPDGDNVSGIDLTLLKEENASVIWRGNLAPGKYTKVFIHVDNVTGILADGGEIADVKLPGEKLQISKPFTIGNSLVNFVYDIAVVEAGKSGQYILKPQVAQSGPDELFNLVAPKGKPERPEKIPKKPGKPEQPDKVRKKPAEPEQPDKVRKKPGVPEQPDKVPKKPAEPD